MKDIMIGESTLLGLSLISGAAGGLAGMYLFRHKIRKKKHFFSSFFCTLAQVVISQTLFFTIF
ncbi:DUF1294 domain-containing protein [Schaedlerella arabinosiphila]|uniref:DUF1294 domain-containing protein n=1 Tax=Schaedlerella arabinosiphila TaxID=2044587 RepID=UPI002557EFE2|nr:DUF1294 domain-containing protein [Schaedlerella arabinosiphila]